MRVVHTPLTYHLKHHKFERLLDVGNNNAQTAIQWGWSADDNGNSYLGAPLLFYVEKVFSDIYGLGTPITVKTSSTSTQLIYNYHIPSNAVNISSPSQTINFSAELNEYTGEVFPKEFI